MRTEYEDASGYHGWADQFLRPQSEAEMGEWLAKADAGRIPVTIAGGLTGLTGGAVAQGGWALSTEKMRRLEVHPGYAIAGPGVRLAEVQAAAKAAGQFFAPDPTEWSASVGGAIATNASGSRSFRYGSMRQHVLGLRVAFLDGTVREFRRGDRVDFPVPEIAVPRTTKHSAGYRLAPGMEWIDLLASTEGTLGVITEATLRLLPLPQELLTGVIFFPSEEAAMDAVEAWRPVPGLRMLEFIDHCSLQLVGKTGAAALLIEQELSAGEPLEPWLERMDKSGALLDESWIAASDADRERFRQFRHSLPEKVNATVIRNGFMKVGSDSAVPLDQNRGMLAYYRSRMEAELPGKYVIYGHVGDAHLHVNSMPATQEEFRRAQELLWEFAAEAAKRGGTVAAEHGLGKRKAKLMPVQYSEFDLAAMRAVKRRFDPHWLLGRGNLFPAP
jgi:FAD/FMN-containing dehydrogenase